MFLVVLQLRQASGNVEPRGIPGGLCIYLTLRQWTLRAKVFSGPKVASAYLRLTVLPSCFRLDSAFFTVLTQRSPSEELRREVSLGCPGPHFLYPPSHCCDFFFSFHSSSSWSVFCLDLTYAFLRRTVFRALDILCDPSPYYQKYNANFKQGDFPLLLCLRGVPYTAVVWDQCSKTSCPCCRRAEGLREMIGKQSIHSSYFV